MLSITTIITSIALAVLGFVLGPLSCKLLNRIPAKWLCDYDEEPTPELLSGDRFKIKYAGIAMGIVLAILMTGTALIFGLSVELPLIIVLYIFLMLISASDAKYTIIPDQFTIAVAVIALIFAVVDLFTAQIFIKSWYSPLLGGLCGGVTLIILDLLSTLIFKKAGFGFGDVKLLAALGIMFGVKYTIIMLLVSFFVAAVHFLVIILAGKAKKGIYLPMGPYICLATAFTIMFYSYFEQLIELYQVLLTMEVLP